MSSTTSSVQDNPSYSFVQWIFIFGCVMAGLGVTTSLGNSIYLAHAKNIQEIKSSDYESLAELAQGSCRGITYLKSMAKQPILNTRGHLKVRRGVYIDSNYVLQGERLASMQHESDRLREQFLIVRMFDRIADPEKIIDIGRGNIFQPSLCGLGETVCVEQ